MRNVFRGYYRPTEQEFTNLWDKCLFVLDANVLLNLYRYSTKTSTSLLDIFMKLSDRMWIPYQAALEYQINRLSIIDKQFGAYKEIEDILKKKFDEIKSSLKEHLLHPYINVEGMINEIDNTFSNISSRLTNTSKEHPNLISNDVIRDEITDILSENVGPAYSANRMEEIYKEGEGRYKNKVPPGYEDAKSKPGNEQYGDLIIWFQTIDKAKEVKNPIILITDDKKEDWWWRFKGEIIGPRAELTEEIFNKANVMFYMYRSAQFMEFAMNYLNQKIDQSIINEVRYIAEISDNVEERYTHLLEHITYMEYEKFKFEKKLEETRLLRERIESEILIMEENDPNFPENKGLLASLHSRENNLLRREEELEQRLNELSERLERLSVVQERFEENPAFLKGNMGGENTQTD